MKNNKIVIYIGLVAIGLLLGWLLFSGSSNEQTEHNHDEVAETNQMWTCSMHPQIMQPEPGDCPICGMDLIPAETSADGLLADQFKLTENAMALANIQTSIVGNGEIKDNTIKLSGKIVINEDETATQPAHFNGRIEKLYINSLGQSVKKGQAIAQVYSPELVTAQQELITAYQIKDSQPELYKAVRNKFKNWKIDNSQLSEIETTGIIKTQFIIYSHVSGVVSEITVNEGVHVMDGRPIFKVTNLATVWANFDVYENQISLFKKGQEVMISTNAYHNKEFKGTVDFIDPLLNTKTRTVTLRVVLTNKNDVFKPGMFVEGYINGKSSSKGQILVIPSTAVLWTGKRSVVYVKTHSTQPVFEIRKIILGNKIGDNYEVLEGVNNGDEIVTNGTFTVDAAAQLQGKKSMMNKDGGKTMTGHEGHLGMDNNASKKESDLTNMNERLEVSVKFQEQLKVVYNDYINLKDALVTDDVKKASTNATNLLNNLGKVDMKLVSDNNAHTHWMSLEKEIKSASITISKTTDIKIQRDHFKHLSLNLINVVQMFGVKEKVYVEFCPMGDNNKGAYWLSKEEKVINPYFGKAMLTCGEVKRLIAQ
ncbi:efflux RND transporter periplasmic adaptor subunit [Ochrovirga pacifica]|uniref:efflux RND transporter periplasmic adaptor subunit n=1 Tax=Ochrovirga pacifica TaxID=1042376 RepID=UPI0002559B57|nr:efflux RND transporter periplasmic adaptor subunit [Ochrovirga pacifica]